MSTTKASAEPATPPAASVPAMTTITTTTATSRASDAYSRQQALQIIRVSGTTTESSSQSRRRRRLVSCPLCGRYSKKVFPLGRGLATHLEAIHTPWKPSPLAQKIHRRSWEAEQRQLQRPSGGKTSVTSSRKLSAYTPTPHQEQAWKDRMHQLLIHAENEYEQQQHQHQQQLPSNSTKNPSNEGVVAYKDSLSPFLQAAAQGDLNQLKELLESSSKNPNNDTVLLEKDRHGSMAEHWAAGGGHLDCLQYLVEQARRHGHQSTYSSSNNHNNHNNHNNNNHLVALPPPHCGPPRKLRRRDGKTALHYACRNGQLACVQYLIQTAGCSMDEASGEGSTPFHMACYGGHLHVVQYLVELDRKERLQKEAKLEPVDDANDSGQATTTVKDAPSEEANDDDDDDDHKPASFSRIAQVVNDWGCGASHWVAMTISKDRESVEELCQYLQDECGVDFGIVQRQGHSALHKAAQRKNRHVLEWMAAKAQSPPHTSLTAAGAAQPDQGGHTPSAIWRAVGGDESFAQWMESQGW